MTEKVWLTVKEAAPYAKVSTDTIPSQSRTSNKSDRTELDRDNASDEKALDDGVDDGNRTRSLRSHSPAL